MSAIDILFLTDENGFAFGPQTWYAACRAKNSPKKRNVCPMELICGSSLELALPKQCMSTK